MSTFRPPSFEDTMRRIAALIAVTAALAGSAMPAAAVAAPRDRVADSALREARSLASTWGRCPTSVPAHRLLKAAEGAPTALRASRAVKARTAWQTVVRECSAPTPTVTVAVG